MDFDDLDFLDDFEFSNNGLESETLYRLYSNYYYNLGFNVTNIGNLQTKFNVGEKELKKSPSHEWVYLIKNRQELRLLNNYKWNQANGVGMVLGFNNYRALDIDGCNDVNFIKKVLQTLNLPEDYEWVTKSGSGNGFHIIFKHENYHPFEFHKYQNVTFLPNSNNEKVFKRLELRWVGHLVLPPSDNFRYKFIHRELPISAPIDIYGSYIERLINIECFKSFTITPNSDGYAYKLEDISILDSTVPRSESFKNDLIPLLKNQGESDYEFIVLDTETNGLPYSFDERYTEIDNWPNIIQLAYYLCDKYGNIKAQKQFYISPENYDIDKKTLKLLNLDYSTLKDYSIPVELVLRQFEQDISNVKFIVGHNIQYDINVLKAEFLRSYDRELNLDTKKTFCTMMSSVNIPLVNNKLNGKYPKLKELYEILLKKEPLGLHNAMNDVEYTYKCFLQILQLKRQAKE